MIIVSLVLAIYRILQINAFQSPEEQHALAEKIGTYLSVPVPGLLPELLLIWLFLCQRTRRKEGGRIQFSENDVWLPANRLRRHGRRVSCRDIDVVEFYDRDRGLRVRWQGGTIGYRRDFFKGRMTDFARELSLRVRAANPEARTERAD